MNQPILFLPCSGAKAPGLLPAIEKYTGSSVWGLLRKNQERFELLQNKAQLIIVSAQYGLLFPDEVVDDYDTTMTPQRLSELTNDYQRQKLGAILNNVEDESIYVALPKAYRLLIEKLNVCDWSLLNTHFYAPGYGIGNQRKQIKEWVEAITLI